MVAFVFFIIFLLLVLLGGKLCRNPPPTRATVIALFPLSGYRLIALHTEISFHPPASLPGEGSTLFS